MQTIMVLVLTTATTAVVLRTRLFLNGQINEDWTYTGRFENNQYYTDETGDDDVSLNWAYVSGRVGGVKMDAGRMDFTFADVVDNRGDGVKLSYGDNVKVYGWAFKASSDKWVNGQYTVNDVKDGEKVTETKDLVEDGDRIYVAGVGAQIGVVDADVRYYNADTFRDQEIYEVAVAGEIAKDLTLRGTYFYGDSDIDGYDMDNSGWLVGLNYRGAKASQPGSWGVYANYSDRPLATYLDPTAFSGYADYPVDANWVVDSANGKVTDVYSGDGYEGFEVGSNVTFAKNIVAAVKYYDFESREGNTDAQTLWTEVVFTF